MIRRRVARMLRPSSFAVLLDIWCGRGAFSVIVADAVAARPDQAVAPSESRLIRTPVTHQLTGQGEDDEVEQCRGPGRGGG